MFQSEIVLVVTGFQALRERHTHIPQDTYPTRNYLANTSKILYE